MQCAQLWGKAHAKTAQVHVCCMRAAQLTGYLMQPIVTRTHVLGADWLTSSAAHPLTSATGQATWSSACRCRSGSVTASQRTCAPIKADTVMGQGQAFQLRQSATCCLPAFRCKRSAKNMLLNPVCCHLPPLHLCPSSSTHTCSPPLSDVEHVLRLLLQQEHAGGELAACFGMSPYVDAEAQRQTRVQHMLSLMGGPGIGKRCVKWCWKAWSLKC